MPDLGIGVKFFIRIAFCVALLSSFACSSFRGGVFDSRQKWKLSQYNITPGWTKAESMVPVSLSSFPAIHPKSYSLPTTIKPGNQGKQASGSAWAVGYLALSYFYQVKKNESGYHCSPAFIYNQTVQGKDIGLEAIQALDFIEESGCSDLRYMPYEEFNLLQRPNMQSIENASSHLIRGFARVDFTDLNQVKAHLLQNSVVIVTIMISENFIDLDQLHWKTPAGKKVGLQTIGVIGYDDLKKTFLIQNSAGETWGDNGRAIIGYDWFLRLTRKAYVIW